MNHLIRAQQLNREMLEAIFHRADEFGTLLGNARGQSFLRNLFCGKTLFSIFQTESLRTRASFYMAGRRLGMDVFSTQDAGQFSSEYPYRGETLEDTITVLCTLSPDIIVLRSPKDGAAKRAAEISSVPIINAGDGKGEHPTQAILDIYTIYRALKTVDEITVLMVGDLRYGRTARSLAYLLAKFASVRLIFVSPPELSMGHDVLSHLKEYGVPFLECEALEKVIAMADVVYCTRVQREKMGDEIRYEDVAHQYCIDAHIMRLMKPSGILLHPLPRNDEINTEIDADPRTRYFEQTKNSVPIRMALIAWALGRLDELSAAIR